MNLHCDVDDMRATRHCSQAEHVADRLVNALNQSGKGKVKGVAAPSKWTAIDEPRQWAFYRSPKSYRFLQSSCGDALKRPSRQEILASRSLIKSHSLIGCKIFSLSDHWPGSCSYYHLEGPLEAAEHPLPSLPDLACSFSHLTEYYRSGPQG